MSDLEYDSGDSLEDLSAEGSALRTAGTEAADGEQESEETSLSVGDPLASGKAEEEEEEEESEAEEGGEGESPVVGSEGGEEGGEGEEGEGPSDEEDEESGRPADVTGDEPEKTAKSGYYTCSLYLH